MHNRAAIAAIAPRSRSSRRDRAAIANKFLQDSIRVVHLIAVYLTVYNNVDKVVHQMTC